MPTVNKVIEPNTTKRQRGRPRTQSLTCAVDGCDRIPVSDNLCRKHWQRRHRTGDAGVSNRRDRSADTQAVLQLLSDGRRRNASELQVDLRAELGVEINPNTLRRLLRDLQVDRLVASTPDEKRATIAIWYKADT